MVDIHKYQKRLDRTLERIKIDSEICEENRNLLFGYHRSLILEGMSVAKTERYLYDAFRFSKSFQKPINLAISEELKDFIIEIEKKTWTVNTKYTFKIGLRKLYKFIDGITEKGKSPERLIWMKTNIKKCQRKLPEDLFNEEEVELLIQHTKFMRDKAFIASLFESGCRIGELGGLKIRDVIFDEYGARIQVQGKTGPRLVRLITSAYYLRDWINLHPTRNRDDLLWVKNNGELMSDHRMSSILKDATKRAKIKKRIYPHLFRHSRSTILARHLTESEMKNVLGWDAGSSMPSIYVHLSSRDSDSAIFKMHGIKTNQESGEIQKEKLCLRCKRMNRPGARLCDTCGFILDKEEAEIILQEEKDRNKADEIMNKLMKDPEIYALIKQKLS